MSSARTRLIADRGSSIARAVATVLAAAAAAPAVAADTGLEEIIVTAQRRETSLQETPVAVTAFSGESLAAEKVFSAGDLAAVVPAFSLTALTPLDQELNMRGITNTRLDSPTSDPSVGTFVDGVYIGRTGDYNFDFFDLERVEVIRGPQGVLLGKNVVGGALSIITARPSQDFSSDVTMGLGNYAAKLVSGHVNGGLTDSLSGRFSFQYRSHDGYGRDILHKRDVEDLESTQVRAQLLWEPGDSGWSVRGIFDYTTDNSNGVNSVPVAGGIKDCESTYLGIGAAGNCTRPWSLLREYLGLDNPRVDMAQSVQFKDHLRQQQYMERQARGFTLDIQKDWAPFSFNSLTGYRSGHSGQLYDQTGIGPEALGWDPARWLDYVAWTDINYGPQGTPCTTQACAFRTYNNGRFLFAQPVNEVVDTDSISQEFRLTSNTDGRLEWIAGLYYKHDNVQKNDRFIGENFLGLVFTGGNNPLSTLSGQNNWYNDGEMTNYGVFGQLAFKFTDSLKLSVGLRYTSDEKKGNVEGVVVETGDRFNPNDPRANVTIESLCRAPDGSVVGNGRPAVCAAPNRWTYGEGDSFRADYSEKWSEVTPQATLDWKISDNVFTYLTYSEGFKGGGYDDTPANPAQATTPFDPEKAKNYEVGVKMDLLDRRMRLNADVFYMDYTNLQVTQTNAACLCNLTDNAAAAEIKGVEAEWEFAATEDLRLSLSGSYVDATYKDFLETAIDPSTGNRLDSSGNRLQRTPETQVSAGLDYTIGMAAININYTWQSDMYWATDNIAKEPSYGLLDASVAFRPANAAWSVAVWGKNITNELYRANIIPFFGEEVSQFGPPRTYGVDLRLKF